MVWLLLLDFWPLRRWRFPGQTSTEGKPAPPLPRLVAEKIPLLLLAGAASVVTYFDAQKVGTVMSGNDLSLAHRVANALVAYTAYLEKMLWPADLAILYPLPREWPAARVALATLLLLGVTVWVLRVIRTAPPEVGVPNIGNAYAPAYDSKREQILVPN